MSMAFSRDSTSLFLSPFSNTLARPRRETAQQVLVFEGRRTREGDS